VNNSQGVVQRVGDKMAMGYEDVSQLSVEVQQLSAGVATIYRQHKTTKKAQRNALDRDFTQKTDQLELRQEYLINAIQYAVYNMLTESNAAPGVDFSKDIDSKDTEMVNSELADIKKYSLLAQGRTIAAKILPLTTAEMAGRQAIGKSTKRKDWNSSIYVLSTSYGRHAIADPIVQGYEKGYMASAMNRKQLIKDWVTFAKASGYELEVATDNDIGKVTVMKEDDEAEREFHIATIYFNDKRFERTPARDIVLGNGGPQQETREVFRHRESGKEYVQDAQGLFVKRFVKRALNKYDNPDDGRGVSIGADPRTKKGTQNTWANIATQVPGMSAPEKDREIQNHQRAKEAQGGSPFVSFTTTDHPIFGSSAKLFESDKGVATVDLARISKAKIFDTHTLPATGRIHNIQKPVPEMPYRDGDDLFERNSAARDAMRTRELVVAGGIPDEAITAVKDKGGSYIKGASGRFQTPTDAIRSYRPPVSPEEQAMMDLEALARMS